MRPCIGPWRDRMADQVKDLDHAFPNGSALEYFFYGHALDVTRLDAVHVADYALQLPNVAHGFPSMSEHRISIFTRRLRPPEASASAFRARPNWVRFRCSAVPMPYPLGARQNLHPSRNDDVLSASSLLSGIREAAPHLLHSKLTARMSNGSTEHLFSNVIALSLSRGFYQIAYAPCGVRNTRSHRRGATQRIVALDEVVISKVQSDGGLEVLTLLA
jgi:hypothetical protein